MRAPKAVHVRRQRRLYPSRRCPCAMHKDLIKIAALRALSNRKQLLNL